MLPGHLVDDYWKEVERKLIKAGGVSIEKVKASVQSFRAELELKAGDMIYHQDAVDTAAAVVNMMDNGDSTESGQ